MNEEKTFEAILISATRIRREIYESATSNIKKAQHKQNKDFARCHLSNSKIKVVDLNDEILKVKSTIFHIEEKATDTGGNTTDFTVAVDN